MHKIEVQFSQSLARFAVSLFTREWIEIDALHVLDVILMVSLFTREWIEISIKSSQVCETTTSPSLRGSGLKSFNLDTAKKEVTSPSLRGSGLKYWSGCRCSECSQVSLFTREWIEMPCSVDRCRADCCVSLFTREWIEMPPPLAAGFAGGRLPLYEGVD